MVDRLQVRRNRADTKPELIRRLLAKYGADTKAMLLWGAFCYGLGKFETACADRDDAAKEREWSRIEAILRCGHPFASELLLILANTQVSEIWLQTNELFEKLQHEDSRLAALALCSADSLNTDEVVAKILALLGRVKFFPEKH